MTVELELDRLDADSSKSADSDAEEMSERGIDEDGGEMECSPLMNRRKPCNTNMHWLLKCI